MEIDNDEFKILQDDVKEIKDALIGNEFNKNGLINRVTKLEKKTEEQRIIIHEMTEFKANTEPFVNKMRIIYWKALGAASIAGVLMSIVIKLIFKYLKL